MHIGDEVLAQVGQQGFAYIEKFLEPDELSAARAGLFELVPPVKQFHEMPDKYTSLTVNQFSGLLPYPFGIDALDSLGTHPDLISAAERYFSSTSLAQHSINVWAKYSGTVDFDQTLHRDYPEKSTVVPSFEGEHDQLSAFVLLSDVGLEDGPTMFVSHEDSSFLAPSFDRSAGLLKKQEQPLTGAAGSAYLFDYTTLHRGSGFRGRNRGRFLMTVEYVRSDRPWLARTRWLDGASRPEWTRAIVRMSPRVRELFGFPAASDPFWTSTTVQGLEERYPGIDTSPYLGRRADHVG